MGRTEPSIGRPPAGFIRDVRSKKAKATINQLIPSLLPTHPRARKGIEATELITNPSIAPPTTSTSVSNVSGPRVALQVGDTLTVAHSLAREASGGRVAILNMASPLSPGGGFVNGANSQEESLCMRTTLLPSLRDEFYRLPELGAIYTPDVLVFRDEQGDAVLPKNDRWFVDCISAAMLRGPETERDELGRGKYVQDSDRGLVLQKMRLVLRVCQAKGIKKVVLGAWGCGAYGNPVGEIASAWRKVLLPKPSPGKGKSKNRETWEGLDKVVFAIKDGGIAGAFSVAFGDGLEIEESVEAEEDDSEMDADETNARELQCKIDELKERIEKTVDLQMKKALDRILAGLLKQLSSGDKDSA